MRSSECSWSISTVDISFRSEVKGTLPDPGEPAYATLGHAQLLLRDQEGGLGGVPLDVPAGFAFVQ